MATKMLQRRDTAANWTQADPILSAGEIGVETDTLKFKIGDDSTAWTALAYAGGSEIGNALVNVNSVESETGANLRLEGNLNVEIFTQGNDINSGNPDVTIGYGGVSCYSVNVARVDYQNPVFGPVDPATFAVDYNNGAFQHYLLSAGSGNIGFPLNMNSNGGEQCEVILEVPPGTIVNMGQGGFAWAGPGGISTTGSETSATFYYIKFMRSAGSNLALTMGPLDDPDA